MITSYEEIDQALAAAGTTCRICGRPLTSFESVQNGVGPVCRGQVNELGSCTTDVDRHGRPRASYVIERYESDYILIKDIGPWDIRPTITNVAESVVEEMLDTLQGRKLYYIDSENEIAELVIVDGKFSEFGFEVPEGIR